jgi:transposase
MAALQFVPVALPQAGDDNDKVPDDSSAVDLPASAAADIHVELRRGITQLTVRWPASQADACAAWLRDVAGTALKSR